MPAQGHGLGPTIGTWGELTFNTVNAKQQNIKIKSRTEVKTQDGVGIVVEVELQGKAKFA